MGMLRQRGLSYMCPVCVDTYDIAIMVASTWLQCRGLTIFCLQQVAKQHPQANLDMLGGDSDAATPPVYQGKLITAKTILSYKRNK